MKKNKLLFLSICIIGLLSFILILGTNIKKTYAKVSTLDLLKTYDTSITLNKEVNDNSGAISVIPDKEGSILEFTNTFNNNFSLKYQLASLDFTGRISIKIEADNDNFSIELCIKNGVQTVAIKKNNEYASIIGSLGNTSIYNKNGIYKEINTSDFYKIDFSSETKVIKAITDNNSYTIWDFTNSINDGKEFYTLNDFTTFNVSIEFSEFNNTPELLIYELNNTYIGNGFIKRDTIPSLSVKQEYEALNSTIYQVPSPLSYDLIDGKINDIYVEVKNSSGNTIISKTLYSDELSFDVNGGSYYLINYEVTNSSKIKNTKTVEVLNYSSYSESKTFFEYENSSLNENREVGKNSKINLPTACLISKLNLGSDIKVNADLYLNDNKINTFENVNLNDEYSFNTSEIGTYKIKYYTVDKYINYSEEYVIEAKEDIVSIVADEMNKVYGLETLIEIPTAKIYFNDDSTNAITKIIFPSGSCYLTNEFKTTEKGNYTVEYYGTINDNYYSFKKEFTVIDTFETAFTYNEGTTVELSSSNVTSKVKGVHVKTKNNESITYNNIINLNDLTKNDCLVELMADCSSIGSPDFTDFNIYLIDAHNSENYILINCMYSKSNSNGNGTYVKTAASNGQILCGWYGSVQTYWGYDTRHSFIGLSDHGEISENTLRFYFDYKELRLYSGPTWGSGFDNQNNMVVDYDDSYFYGIPFKGFTTGEIYLKIEVKGATKREVGYTIKTIGGDSFENGTFISKKAPEIVIDNENEVVPFAISNTEYKLKDAYAIDKESGEKLSTTRTIYYNYSKESEAEIPYDGSSFTPTKSGLYTIIYKAVDKYNNVSIKIINIECLMEALDIDFTLSTIKESVYLGESIKLPTVSDIINTSGTSTISYKVLLNDNEIETSDVISISKEGTYKIQVTVKDYLNRETTKTLTITSSISVNPILVDDLVLPRYFLTEHEYKLMTPNAIDYNEEKNGKLVEPKIYVTDNFNTNKLLENNTYNPVNDEALNEYDANIKYVYETLSGELVIENTIKVIKARSGREFFMANYFYTDLNKTLNEDSISFEYTNEVKTVDFVNAINVNTFEIDFSILKNELTNIDYINFYLTDSKNSKNKVTINVYRNENYLYVSINGSESKVLNSATLGEAKNQYAIKFDDNAFKDIQNKTIVSFEESIFTSETIYLTIEGKGAQNFTLDILSLNNQSFTSLTKYDKSSPELNLGNFGGSHNLNEVITLTEATAFDVLSDISLFTLSVKYENTYVKDINGVELKDVDATKEYSFILNSYGKYIVSYSAKDDGGKSSLVTTSKTILVTDDIRPEITLESNYKSNYKAGQEIEIIKASVNDNLSKDLTYSIYIVKPNGMMEKLDNDKYTFVYRGTYIIRYFAVDNENNITTLDVIVEIK